MKLSQSSTNVVVWEWMNEFGRWRPYAPHVTQFIENSYVTGPHNQQVNLGSADSSLSSYAVDFVTTCQIRLGTGTARPIRRSTYPQSCPAGKGIVWQWEGDMQGQWHMYEMDVACALEDSHSQNPRMALLDLSKSSLKIPYHIDFSRMIQIRIETGRVRKIRRATLKQAYPSGVCGSSTASASTASSNTVSCAVSHSKRSSTSTATIGASPAKKLKSGLSVSQNVAGVAPTSNMNIAGNNSLNSFPMNSQPGIQNFSNSHSHVPQVPGQSRRITRSLVNAHIAAGAGQTQNHFQHNSTVTNIQQNPSFPQNSNILQNSGGYSNQHPLFPQAGGYMMSNGPAPNIAIGPPVSIPQGFMGSVPMGMFPVHSGLPGGSSVITAHNSQSVNVQGPGPMFSHSVGGRRSGSQHVDIPEEAKIPNAAPKQNKKGKMSDTEMFEQFTEVIQQPPQEEDCCICCEKLCHASGYGEGQMENHVVYQMNKCSHMFHKLCLIAMYENGSKNGSMQCPTCKTIYGEKHGNCPKGVMEYSTMSQPLPGYPDCQTIRIMYHISPGVQAQEHPHPGKRFSCRGFPRICFLPDSDDGRKILKLLIVAWRRRLTFTIGQSTTTGESDTVTWNEIHHKTEFGSNVSGHGFPDEKYFDNVLQELAVQGVTEKDI